MSIYDKVKEIDIRQVLDMLGVSHGRGRLACPVHGGRDQNAQIYKDHITCFSVCAGEHGDIGKKFSAVDLVLAMMDDIDTPYKAACWILGEEPKEKRKEYKQQKKEEFIKHENLDEAAQKCIDQLQVIDMKYVCCGFLHKRGFTRQEWKHLDIGVLPSKDKTVPKLPEAINHLWGRIVFVLRDIDGNVIGMQGRSIDGMKPSVQGKYASSKNTSKYTKSAHLYPIHLAAEHIRYWKIAILVEGHFDAAALHIAEYPITLAIGTKKISDAQAKQLKKLGTTHAIVIADDDTQGGVGAKATSKVLAKHGIKSYIRILGEDPAEHLKDWLMVDSDNRPPTEKIDSLIKLIQGEQNELSA